MKSRALRLDIPALAALPVLYVLLAFALRLPVGQLPSLSAISLPYLFNGFLASWGERFYFNGHPGLPLTLFVALLLRIWHFFQAGGQPFTENFFLDRHEEILTFVTTVIPLLNACMLFTFGRLARRRFSLRQVVVAQALFFLSPRVLSLSTHLRPEALSVSLACLNTLLLLGILSPRILPPFLATLVALKHTYGIYVLELLLLKKWWKILAGLTIAFVVYVSFFQFLDPPCVTCSYAYYFQSFLHRTSGGAMFAHAPVSYITWSTSFNHLLVALFAFSLGGLGVFTAFRRREGGELVTPLRIVLVMFFAEILLVAIHPVHLYYFFAALELLPALYLLVSEQWPQTSSRLMAGTLGVLVLNLAAVGAEFGIVAEAEKNSRIQYEARAQAIGQYPGCSIVYDVDTMSWKPVDLFRANQYVNFRLGGALSARYPQVAFFSETVKLEYLDYSGKQDPAKLLDKLRTGGRCLLFVSMQNDVEAYRTLKPLLGAGTELKVLESGSPTNILYAPGRVR